MLLPPKNEATMWGSAAPYRQLRVNRETEKDWARSLSFTLTDESQRDRDLQLMDVIIFNVDIEVVFLQQAVHT